ncbi:MAG TPA: FecR domain-containing protein [Stellaceae bacterium]|nr:FecR domain-containing protein [Stellaceae bacterium]
MALTFCLRGAAFAFAAALIAAPAFADGSQVAQVKTASGAASVMRDGKASAVKPGDALYEKDTLQTGADGSIGITFTDDSVLSLGPNSEAALSQYNFDSSNFKGTMLTDLRKGTASMVSGDIARSSPSAMKVRTPTATLAVRGTSFAIQVGQ